MLTAKELHLITGCSILYCKRAIEYCEHYPDTDPMTFLRIMYQGPASAVKEIIENEKKMK